MSCIYLLLYAKSYWYPSSQSARGSLIVQTGREFLSVRSNITYWSGESRLLTQNSFRVATLLFPINFFLFRNITAIFPDTFLNMSTFYWFTVTMNLTIFELAFMSLALRHCPLAYSVKFILLPKSDILESWSLFVKAESVLLIILKLSCINFIFRLYFKHTMSVH